jgi:4-hydroxy-4-methyl-2-oxoglutarate aldolase
MHSHSDLLQLKRWNTPTIYNGWEQITRRDPAADGFNLEETRDFMAPMGPMLSYAITRAKQQDAPRPWLRGHHRGWSHPRCG